MPPKAVALRARVAQKQIRGVRDASLSVSAFSISRSLHSFSNRFPSLFAQRQSKPHGSHTEPEARRDLEDEIQSLLISRASHRRHAIADLIGKVARILGKPFRPWRSKNLLADCPPPVQQEHELLCMFNTRMQRYVPTLDMVGDALFADILEVMKEEPGAERQFSSQQIDLVNQAIVKVFPACEMIQ